MYTEIPIIVMYFNRHEFMDKQIMHQSCDVLQLDSVHAHFDISI